MRAILLAGGAGTRLNPITQAACKQLLPVYDKPMIYYPLSVIMLADIREALIISTPQDLPTLKQLLGDGGAFGMALHYAEQASPNGVAEAFLIGEAFLRGEPCCLILGDNILFGHGLTGRLRDARNLDPGAGATVFGYRVDDPTRYGVIGFDAEGNPDSITEKPTEPASRWAVIGLYFYDEQVVDIARSLTPSPRGELEISDVNAAYLQRDQLAVERLGRGYAWFDAGTPDSLLDASAFVQSLEKRQGLKIACLEEIAFDKGWISVEQLAAQAHRLGNGSYAQYLRVVAEDRDRAF